jgi:glutamate--cysteine ligase
MRGICEMLDEGQPRRPYIAALEVQEAKLHDPSLTPSARSLAELASSGDSFFDFALRMSALHKSYFLDLYPPNEQRLQEFRTAADESLRQQAAIEAADTLGFDEYLARYFG